jgi:glycosyltransferase involved in cell wall biosynthesis
LSNDTFSSRRPGDERSGRDRTILWWGRSEAEYPRNETVRRCLIEADYKLLDFRPRVSAAGDIEASLRVRSPVALVWVPCFRQRDLAAARRWSHRRGVPLVFDPLISAYDKQVFEREKFPADGIRAARLLNWERRLFASADMLVADTCAHAEYFHRTHGVPEERIHVVPLCAEEALFRPLKPRPSAGRRLQVLFFGSFIPLQGAQVIVEAANLKQGPQVDWCLLGNGPQKEACVSRAQEGAPIRFENWVPYENLPARIADADIVLGIFGSTPKAARVVPNKLCQALACGRPVVTRATPAIPEELARQGDSGLILVPPSDPRALADAVAALAGAPAELTHLGRRASETYSRYFSAGRVAAALGSMMERIFHCRAAK